MSISSPYASVFKYIRILDSTVLQLPDIISSVYSGPSKHMIALKAQCVPQLWQEKIYVSEI